MRLWTHKEARKMRELDRLDVPVSVIARKFQTHRRQVGNMLQKSWSPARVAAAAPARKSRKWTEADAKQMRAMRAIGMTDSEISEEFNCDPRQVARLVTGR